MKKLIVFYFRISNFSTVKSNPLIFEKEWTFSDPLPLGTQYSPGGDSINCGDVCGYLFNEKENIFTTQVSKTQDVHLNDVPKLKETMKNAGWSLLAG
ncbi:MAG: hypothetical protein WAV23_03170 [Minisyncoccia bacterium]